MSKVSASKMFLAMLALLVCAGMLQAQPATPLTATPSSITVNYVVPSGPGSAAPVVLKAASNTDFFLDSTTMPFWLTADNMSGTATAAGFTVNFNSLASGASTLAAGNYSASVHVKASGFSDLLISVTLVVSDPTSTVSVSDSTGALTSPGTLAASRNIHWRPGTPLPTEVLTVTSNNQPISFSVSASATTPAAPAWLSVSQPSGIAYNFGSSITASFLADTLNNAVGGLSTGAVTLTGTVTITPASGSAQVVTINIILDEPYAVATSLFPSQTPVQASGNLTVVVTGNYFGSAGGYSSATTATLTYNGGAHTGALGAGGIGGSAVVASPTTLILTIPAKDNAGTPNPILTAPDTVTIAIQNGVLGSPVNLTLTITNSPIIYEVTDAASLAEPAAGTNPTFAPYELISIFGANLLGGNASVTGTLDADSRYPNSLSAGGHNLTVGFNDHAGHPIANAYLLFASDTQINALVPSGVLASSNTQVQIIVTYNAVSSTASIANVAAANPGTFTTGASGQGQGAILLSNYTVNSNTSASTKAAAGSTILVYLSGMGAPDSTSANTASTKAAAFPASCIAAATGTTSYMATVNTNLVPAPLWTSADGAVILGSQITNGHFAPCFATTKVTATIQGLPATVTYAGWVVGSVAGLYQVNLTVPTKATTGDQPIVVTVTSGGKTYTSQAGVTVAIK